MTGFELRTAVRLVICQTTITLKYKTSHLLIINCIYEHAFSIDCNSKVDQRSTFSFPFSTGYLWSQCPLKHRTQTTLFSDGFGVWCGASHFWCNRRSANQPYSDDQLRGRVNICNRSSEDAELRTFGAILVLTNGSFQREQNGEVER